MTRYRIAMNTPAKPDPSAKVLQASQQPLTIDHAMALAAQLQANGQLPDAEHLLRKILQHQPSHPFALHLLGVIAHQCGQQALAAELIERAISHNNDVALFHANLCEILRQLKRLDQAIIHGERAVTLEPRMTMAQSNLGIAYFDRKDFDKAEACQQLAIALEPNFAPSLNNLGSIWRERKDKAAALDWYRKAAAANPNYLEPLSNLGALLLEEDRGDEAAGALEKALRLNPDFAEAVCNIGGVHLAREDYDSAMNCFKRAAGLRPAYLEAQLGIAKTFQAADHPQEAEAAAQAALRIDPGSAKAHALLAGILTEASRAEQAEAEYLRALELDSECDDALLGLGHLCVENGDNERAERLFDTALQVRPDNISARIQHIQVKKVTPDNEHFRALLALQASDQPLSDNRKMALHFALGKCYEDIKEYDQAFPHFLEGCRMKRQRLQYDAEVMAREFASFIDIFSKDYIDSLRGSGDPSPMPIFVLGMPRSGTTLTEQIIASHPDVFGAGELPELLRIAHRKTRTDVNTYPDNLRHLDAQTLRAWGTEYVAAVRQRAPDAVRITDKMPANFFALPLIHLMLPNARIIHVNRNPVDTCVSCFARQFHRKQEHTYDLAELGRYYADYAKLMAHWRKVLPDGAFLDIQYENIVADQEAQARRLLEYCGLEWNDACLDFHKTRRQVRTASLTQVRQPIYNSSVERWRKYEKFLGPLLNELGDLAK
jgi:tetratricopeptide (TPR) repeat protein